MDVPQELLDDVRVMVQTKYDVMMDEIESEVSQMVTDYVTRFVDVTDISDGSKRLMHVATGRILTIKVEMK